MFVEVQVQENQVTLPPLSPLITDGKIEMISSFS